MTNPELSLEDFRDLLVALSPDERYERLKSLELTELWVQVFHRLPSRFWQEYMFFENRPELEASQKHVVPSTTIEDLIPGCGSDAKLESLLRRHRDGDEFWFYQAVPGDSGYALVREGQVIDFCTLEVVSRGS